MTLQTMIEYNDMMNDLKVYDVQHAKYLDRENRMHEIDEFTRRVRDSDLHQLHKNIFFSEAERSMTNLIAAEALGTYKKESGSNPGRDNLYLNILIALVSFLGGWKANSLFKDYENSKIEEFAQGIFEIIKGETGANM